MMFTIMMKMKEFAIKAAIFGGAGASLYAAAKAEQKRDRENAAIKKVPGHTCTFYWMPASVAPTKIEFCKAPNFVANRMK